MPGGPIAAASAATARSDSSDGSGPTAAASAAKARSDGSDGRGPAAPTVSEVGTAASMQATARQGTARRHASPSPAASAGETHVMAGQVAAGTGHGAKATARKNHRVSGEVASGTGHLQTQAFVADRAADQTAPPMGVAASAAATAGAATANVSAATAIAALEAISRVLSVNLSRYI